jgi:hypothetical protein
MFGGEVTPSTSYQMSTRHVPNKRSVSRGSNIGGSILHGGMSGSSLSNPNSILMSLFPTFVTLNFT